MLQKINYLRMNFIILAIWGVIMTFMIPAWQTPDEMAHLNIIGESIGVSDLSNIMREEMDMGAGRVMRNPEEKIDIGEWKTTMSRSASYDAKECLPHKISPLILKHLPATIGVIIGISLHLPAFWVLELAEIFALVFYLCICYISIRIIPIKKEILMIFMSLPMVMQQASSISYDAVLIPICFLFIAYTTKLYCTEEIITWKQLVIWILLLLLITYIKLPYVVFGVLIFGIPTEKICLAVGTKKIDGEWIHKNRWYIRVAIVLGLGIGIYLVKDNVFVSLVITMIQEWRQSLRLFYSTVVTFWRYLLVSTIGCFGWLESQVPTWFEILAYTILIILSIKSLATKHGNLPKTKQIICILAAFFLLVVFITISMVNHTITVTMFGEERDFGSYDLRAGLYCIPFIGGLQGRYYLPFLPLLFLGLGKTQTYKKDIAMEMSVTAFMTIAAITTLVVLYHRYWI